jgi:hypothetical protein
MGWGVKKNATRSSQKKMSKVIGGQKPFPYYSHGGIMIGVLAAFRCWSFYSLMNKPGKLSFPVISGMYR